MAECPESSVGSAKDAEASEAPIRSSSVSLSTSGGGGRLLRSPPPPTRAQLTLTRELLECRQEHQAETVVSLPRRSSLVRLSRGESLTSGTTEAGSDSEFPLEDLVGVEVLELPPPHNETACQMNTHFFSKRVERKKTGRKMRVLQVCFDTGESFADNRAEACKWKEEIKLYTHLKRSQVLHNIETKGVGVEASTTQLQRRHLLVLVNPVSGQGKAVQEFQEQVRPLFELAEINFTAVVTERQNHARELMKEYDFSNIDGIVIVSGDGLLYEVVNGLMEREDWEEALKTPIGMLPTGSGNALCASTLYEAGEEYNLLNAAFQIIQGGVIPMDITTVETADKKTLYMTILAGWGLISDIDIESESLRKIGETRFILGALNCIRRKRIYRGRLVYLPWDESEAIPTTALSQSAPTGTFSISSSNPPTPSSAVPELATTSLNPQLLSRGGVSGTESSAVSETPDSDEGPLVSSEESEKEKSDVFGETKDIPIIESSLSPIIPGAEAKVGVDKSHKEEVKEDVEVQGWELVQGEQEAAPEDKIVETEPIQIPTTSPQPPVTEPGISQQTPTSLRSFSGSAGPTPHLLPEISEAVPDNWKVIEGDFLTVSPIMIPHLSSNFFGDPKMSIGTGKIRIVYVKSMSRFGMLSLLTKAEKGTHLERPEVQVIDVKAFRLEPRTEEGVLTVDGEVVKYGLMQAQVHQHLARVYCCKRV